MNEYILSLSYGKDSLACLGAIEQLGLPLDRIVTAEVWATDTIPADLPPMMEFKAKADAIIRKRWGITVEHLCATRRQQSKDDDGEKQTYEKVFYRVCKSGKRVGEIYGFPGLARVGRASWCTGELKKFLKNTLVQGVDTNIMQYLGIAANEPERIARHNKPGIILPLVEIDWTETDCRKWCEENDLLSPIYAAATRGGCWFWHNQSVGQLRLLRKNYPAYWALLLRWDKDSPVTFRPDGHTVHDYDRRFALEDAGFLSADDKIFRWSMLDEELNYRWF